MSGVQYFQIYDQPPGPLPASEPLFKNLEILKINDIYKLSIGKFIYNTLDNESPNIFSEWFIYSHLVHVHSTRSNAAIIQRQHFDVGRAEPSKNLHTQRSNLVKYGHRKIQVSGPILWNSFPDELKDAPSIYTFNSRAKKYFLAHYGN